MKRYLAQFIQSLDIIDYIKNNAKRNVLFRSFYKFGAQQMIDRAFPQRMHLDPAGVCNLDCIMCAPRLTEKPMGLMDFELFKKIIDESARFGPRTFALCKDGEPLLNPRFLEMVAYIKQKNPKNVIAMTTNGILLDGGKSQALLACGIDKITVSIRAASAQTYDKICKSPHYEQVVENVKELLRLKKVGGFAKPYVFLQCLPLKELADEREKFKEIWKGYDVTLDMSGLFSWSGMVEGQKIHQPDFSKRYPCYELWFTPAINWNGDVSVCSYDWDRTAIIGNLKEESLADIWQGKKMSDYRKMHLEGRANGMSVCEKCEIWSEYPDIFFSWQKK